MFYLREGPSLTGLARLLSETLAGQPLTDPLKPEIFVVQNHGMARWLSLFLAKEQGVVANLQFEFPAERIWKLIRVLHPEIPEHLPSDLTPMAWSLMRILEEDKGDSDLKILRTYIEAEGKAADRMYVRTYKLSKRIADLFDQYQVYRHEMLLKWEKGNLTSDDATERWQALLWRKLTGRWKHRFADVPYTPHRAALHEELHDAVLNKILDSKHLPRRLHLFGISTMPPIYAEVIAALSEHVDIYWYTWTAPYTDESSNASLVQSMGQEGQDFRLLLEEMLSRKDDAGVKFERAESYSDNGEKVKSNAESGFKSLLREKQIQIHSCHSPMREVEVLYDRLLALLEEDETLCPDDILIACTDLSTYAPLIDAVFGISEEGHPSIPYSIGEHQSGQDQVLSRLFLKLLELCESRFKVTDVLDLLNAGPIRRKFGLSEEDLTRIEKWIDENRIKWGINAGFRKQMELPADPKFTWESGLARMILGYAMSPEGDRLYEGHFPYAEIEGAEDAGRIGRFMHIMQGLFSLHEELTRKRSLEQWCSFLMQKMVRFLPEEDDAFRELTKLRNIFEDLKEYAALADAPKRLPFPIIRLYITEAVERQKTGGFVGSGITFSSMFAMRSIPYRVIGLIGMNDGAFPRRDQAPEFDLMQRHPRKGDRSRKRDDRYLFLENLLAADKSFYISYIGQSNHEDSRFPPSVLVRELIDFLQDDNGEEADGLIIRHPLQSFSSRYFSPEHKALFSYSSVQQKVCESLADPDKVPHRLMEKDRSLAEPEDEWRTVSIRNLIDFYQHPAKFLMRNRLGVMLKEQEVITEDRELFDLGGLEGWRLGQDLLERYLAKEATDAYRQRADAVDLLPSGWPGRKAFAQKEREAGTFFRHLQDLMEAAPEEAREIDIDSELESFRVVGTIDKIYSDSRIDYRFGKMRAKELIENWIKHLLLQVAADKDENRIPTLSKLYTHEGDGMIKRSQWSPIPEPEAKKHLAVLLSKYLQGLSKPLPFFPDSSFTFARQLMEKGKSEELALKKAKKKWKNRWLKYRTEGEDLYNKLLFYNYNPLEENEFIETSKLFWSPVYNAMTQEDFEPDT